MSLATEKAPSEDALRMVTDHALEDIRRCEAQVVECGITAGDAIEVSAASPQEVGVESIQHSIHRSAAVNLLKDGILLFVSSAPPSAPPSVAPL
ncbi:MAG: hypothetical protein VCB79_00780, partial [Dehalococcoidia bacterium]